MEENIVIGRKIGFSFWNYLYKIARDKVQRKQKVELRIISASFPTSNSCIVKYERVDTRHKFEHIMQGKYGSHYRSQVKDAEYIPEGLQIDNVIKNSYLKRESYLVN